jgi:hypothetical protein
MSNLPKGDQKTVQRQIQTLPQRIKEAQDKEVGEMWGKLKEVCSFPVRATLLF